MKKIRELDIIYTVIIVAVFQLAAMSSAILGERALFGEPAAASPTLAVSSTEPTPVAQAAAPEPKKVPPKPKPANPAYPARLSIPKIEVNAPVQPVGLARSGNISAPASFSTVGWFNQSALPGKTGSVIMDGHVDNGFFRSGVFSDLDEVVEGDELYVTTHGGTRLRYIVTHTATYDYKAVPMGDIVKETDTAQLVLITCGGNWIGEEKTYDQRLVVYAKLAE